MVCKASSSIWWSVGPDGSLVKKSCRHGGDGTGASSGQRPKLEVASQNRRYARLTSPVDVMREGDVEDEDGGA
jgi:hypothetical protein